MKQTNEYSNKNHILSYSNFLKRIHTMEYQKMQIWNFCNFGDHSFLDMMIGFFI